MILTLAIGILLSTVHDNHAETPTQRAPTALRCGTPYLLQAMDASTEHQRLKLVQRRPSTQHQLLTPSGHFRVHYDTEGRDAIDLTDDDANGIPDYIDLAVTVLDSIWVLEVEQLGYYAHGDGSWWQESTSTWMEEVAYPHIDDYLQYLTYFLGEPQRALNSGRPKELHLYGTSIFSHFLDQHYSRDLNRLIWEELKERGSVNLDHFDRVLRQVEPGGLGVVAGEFAVWNYFTGTRHRDEYYAEGDKYPSVLIRDMDVAAAVVRDTSLIDATGSVYLRLQPQLRPGGVDLFLDSIRGAWRRHLLLVGPDTLSVQLVSEPTIRISGWDQFDEIVLVASSAERTGLAYQHLFTAQFDPNLTDRPAALATLLKPNYPNPFRPGQHAHTRLAFDLAFPSMETRLALFTANGTLVWEQDLGERAAREDHAVLWDGRNLAGNLVASGIYHLLLEADGTAAKRSLAVVRH